MMPRAAVERYWDWLKRDHPDCPCGAPFEQIHHVIHVNSQRITKDDFLVIGLCDPCHRRLHALGGDRQFEEETGHSTVHLATLRRHNFEVRNG
jgi:hypothetical protein